MGTSSPYRIASREEEVSARRLVPVPRQSFPFGIPAYLAIIGRREGLIRATEDPLIGDVLPTAGGLALTGEGDLSAFDAKAGERLWGFSLAHGK